MPEQAYRILFSGREVTLDKVSFIKSAEGGSIKEGTLIKLPEWKDFKPFTVEVLTQVIAGDANRSGHHATVATEEPPSFRQMANRVVGALSVLGFFGWNTHMIINNWIVGQGFLWLTFGLLVNLSIIATAWQLLRKTFPKIPMPATIAYTTLGVVCVISLAIGYFRAHSWLNDMGNDIRRTIVRSIRQQDGFAGFTFNDFTLRHVTGTQYEAVGTAQLGRDSERVSFDIFLMDDGRYRWEARQ